MRRLITNARRAPSRRIRGDWFLPSLLLAMLAGLAIGLLVGIRLVLADSHAPTARRATAHGADRR